MKIKLLIPLACLVMLLVTPAARARNVDLSTVPDRDTVQLTIYNSEDLTLVRETRKVTFKKGINPLQFSWANTLIDPTSVELRFLTSPDKLDVLDTTYPHDKPQMLYWNVQSDLDGEATIEITYFTSGITWSADYICIADADETKMGFEGFVRVTNNSGEDYENAQVRLVVGTINLVEKIAQLAQVPMSEVAAMDKDRRAGLRRDVAMKAMNAPAASSHAQLFGSAGGGEVEKQIIKEGLSEYFIYTIEGTETIPNQWAKRMRSFEGKDAAFKVQYRYRPREYGDQLVRMYLLTNDKDSKLGTTPLPDGMVRVFRRNGRDGLSFLAEQHIKYVPIGDKIEINLGPDPEVIFELIQLRAWRDNIWMQLNGADVFRRVDDGAAEVEINSSVVGWDEHNLSTQRIRNYTSKPIDVEIRRSYEGDIIFRSGFKPTPFDADTVRFTAQVDPGKRVDLLHEVVSREGRNRKEPQHITLEDAEVKR